METPRLYTIRQAKAIGGFGTTTLYKFVNDGVLDAVKLGGRTLITGRSLHALIDGLPRLITTTMRRRASEKTEPGASLPASNARRMPRRSGASRSSEAEPARRPA
jgi:hypothetical protein